MEVRKSILLAALVGPLLGTSTSSATVVPKMTMAELADQSAAAVVVRTLSVEPEEDAKGRPVTKVTLAVNETLMGSVPSTLTFKLPGGYDRRRNVIKSIAGAPAFEQGESYLIFIRRGAWMYSPVTNWWHSHFRVASVEGRQIFVDSSGRGVTGVDDKGFNLGAPVQGVREANGGASAGRSGGVVTKDGRRIPMMPAAAAHGLGVAASVSDVRAQLAGKLATIPGLAASRPFSSEPMTEPARIGPPPAKSNPQLPDRDVRVPDSAAAAARRNGDRP